ncbi:hypothetical protein F4820DRAFT_452906 [Hypoxylon rubiginosum]|uniref:Uncharacterized protein n=1 Tax=Hypoxylon rubiginosum TaxID=110542 RepID=A0ACB9YM92_9PEZI|nr:hypothetical protein F4820DRAFT_452906 [Hypoxylon rubiginosum]
MTSDELLVTSQKLTSTESFKPTNEPAPPNFEAVSGFELTTSGLEEGVFLKRNESAS